LTVAVKRKSSANFAQLTRLLIHPNLSAHLMKRDSCGQSTDTAADDRYS
jgi:hypothetical protein